MTKVYAVVVVVLLLVAGAFYAGGRQGAQKAAQAEIARASMATQLRTANASLKAANEAWDRERSVLEERARARVQHEQKATVQKKELDNAVQEHRTWAAEPVPDSVWDAVTGIDAGSSARSR